MKIGEKDLPETFMGYSTKELLKTLEEISSPGGTKAPEEKIIAMRDLLREYRLGVYALTSKTLYKPS